MQLVPAVSIDGVFSLYSTAALALKAPHTCLPLLSKPSTIVPQKHGRVAVPLGRTREVPFNAGKSSVTATKLASSSSAILAIVCLAIIHTSLEHRCATAWFRKLTSSLCFCRSLTMRGFSVHTSACTMSHTASHDSSFPHKNAKTSSRLNGDVDCITTAALHAVLIQVLEHVEVSHQGRRVHCSLGHHALDRAQVASLGMEYHVAPQQHWVLVLPGQVLEKPLELGSTRWVVRRTRLGSHRRSGGSPRFSFRTHSSISTLVYRIAVERTLEKLSRQSRL